MRRGRRLPIEQLQPYLVDVVQPIHTSEVAKDFGSPGPSLEPLIWPTVFGNHHPVEIEVGFGKGLFLLQQSQARPATNFLGIEIERAYVLFTATRLAKRGLTNVRLASCDARWFLKEMVQTDSVAAIHVYFPDPWWKTRHRKRRVFTEEFAAQCARVLQVGGLLHFATDVEEYFEQSLGLMALPELTRRDLPAASISTDVDFLTNFEKKYREEGRPIFRALFEKVGTSLAA